MSAVVAGLASAGVVGGVWLVVDGVRRHPRSSTSRSTGLWTKVDKGVRRAARRGGRRWIVGLAAGVVAAAVTGWVVLMVAVPVCVVVIPRLLADPPDDDVALARALERWVRLVAASAGTGKSVMDAVRATRPQAPEELATPLAALVVRLDSRWEPDRALRALADDLDSADADEVVAALLLAVEFGGTGAPTTLLALASSLQDRIRVMREIAAERAKPRIVARQVTTIIAVVAVAAVVAGRSFLAPYGTAVGQVLLAGYVGLVVAALAVLARRSRPRRRERLLVGGRGA